MIADIVNGEIVPGVMFRIGEVNPRPLDETHKKDLMVDLGNRNVCARKYPMTGGVRKGDILNLEELVGKEYTAMSTIPVVRFSEAALGELITLLAGQHRYHAAMAILEVLVAEYGAKSAALGTMQLKTAQFDQMVSKASLVQAKGGAKAIAPELWAEKYQAMIEQQSEMWGEMAELAQEVEELRTAIREIRFWPIKFYSIGE